MSTALSNEVWKLENVNKCSTEHTQTFSTIGCGGATAVIRILAWRQLDNLLEESLQEGWGKGGGIRGGQ